MTTLRAQSGSMIIESMISLILLAIGILGLIGLQAAAYNTNADTGYRVEANNYANRMLSTIQGGVSRTSSAQYLLDLAAFAHKPNGGDNNCQFEGADSADPDVIAWLDDLRAATGLPGASGQIRVINSGSVNQVRVVVCWQQPGLPVPRRHVLMGTLT